MDYKNYFNKPLVSVNNVIERILTPIFGNFQHKEVNEQADCVNKFGNGGANIEHIYDYGYFKEQKEVSVWEVVLADNCHISRARKNIQNTIRSITENYTGAFIIFHYADGSANPEAQTWRLSWLMRTDAQVRTSPAKRYTYLCGPSYSCRTIAERFEDLHNEPNKTLATITTAFDVEALSKDFFYEYKVFYDDIIQWITGTRYVGEKDSKRMNGLVKSNVDLYTPFAEKCKEVYKREWGEWTEKRQNDRIEKFVRDWVKKLLGRLVFLQFIQKKGWLGIPDTDRNWTNGNENFLMEQFNLCAIEDKNFLKDVLYDILFESLNKSECKDDGGVEISKRNGIKYPFLNGGLFEEEPADTLHIELPNKFFHNKEKKDISHSIGRNGYRENREDFFQSCGLLDFFGHYNFTIDENSSEDDESEVGIDPEMLSKVFENLLEDNKEKGAFYTPKEIVQYMCKESLIAYLCREIKGLDYKIRCFVETVETDKDLLKNRKELLDALHKVKICDPAVGSGAFPMGLLNLILNLRLVLNDDADCADKEYDYAKLMSKIKKAESDNNENGCKQEKAQLARIKCAIKKHIIQNNIYGVDIEKGAVDLARLRFWLNIVVDEDKPTPLPNLDYKFMQGNSLLEQYNGVDLSVLSTGKKVKMQMDLFDNENNLKQFQSLLHSLIQQYFQEKDHNKKDELKQKIQNNVNNQMKVAEVNLNFTDLGIDVAGNDQFFLWHTWFADVFENGGFDIVIGNPPFVFARDAHFSLDFKKQIEKDYFSNLTKNTKSKSNQSGKINLFALFIMKGIMISTKNGILSYIVPNNILRATTYNLIRKYILDNTSVCQIVDLGSGVFEKVTASTIILQLENISCANNGVLVITDVKRLNNRDATIKIIPQSQFIQNTSFAFNIFGDLTSVNLTRKIKNNAKMFGDYCVDIIEGIVAKKNLIFTEAGNNRFPMLEGRCIKKYSITGINKYIEWNKSEIHRARPDYLWEQTEKLVNQRISGGAHPIVVAYDTSKFKAFASVNNIVLKDDVKNLYKYFLALLNSNVLNWYYANNFSNNSDLTVNISKTYLEKLPIHTSINNQQPITDLVDLILAAKKANPQADTTALERKIDILVYLLYNLTYDEVMEVENSLIQPTSDGKKPKKRSKKQEVVPVCKLNLDKATYDKWLEKYQTNGTLPSEEEMEKAVK